MVSPCAYGRRIKQRYNGLASDHQGCKQEETQAFLTPLRHASTLRFCGPTTTARLAYLAACDIYACMQTEDTPSHATGPRPARSKDDSAHVTDERFNTVSHLGALIFAIVGTGYLIAQAAMTASRWHVVGFALYGFGLCTLFLCSTLHHGVNASTRTENLLKTLDYVAIYLLIAGTFSPICLVLGRDPLGWSILGTVWLVSLIGIALRAFVRGFPSWVGMGLYLILGWVAILLGPTVFRAGPCAGWLLVAGGLFYTAGGVVFTIQKPNPIPGRFGFHEIWHIFVIAGAASHYMVMLQLLST